MDSKLPEKNGLKTHGGNYCEPIESNYIQGNSVNTFNYESDDVSKIRLEQLVFVLSGSVHEINPVRLRITETHLRKFSGYKQIVVNNIEE